MNVLFLAAYLLCNSVGLWLCAQTPLILKPRASASKKQLPRGNNKGSQPGPVAQARLLQGAWATCSACDFDFALQGNHVLFYDPGTDGEQEVVHWKVANNKLSFFYKGGSIVTDQIVKLTPDSLVLYRRDKEAGIGSYSRYVRLK
jgi:hypothetical protein